MVSRHPVLGRHLDLGSAAPSLRASGPRVEAPDQRRTWLASARAEDTAPGRMQRPGLRVGALPGHLDKPRTRSGLSAKPVGRGQWWQGLVSRGAPTTVRSPPPLPCAPPHLPRPTSRAPSAPDLERELRWGSPGDGRCGHSKFFLQPRGGGGCNLRLPPRLPPTAPITHSLSLSRQQGGSRSQRGECPGMPATGRGIYTRFALTHQSPLGETWGDGTTPCRSGEGSPKSSRHPPPASALL